MLRENARVLALLRVFFDILCIGISFAFIWFLKFETHIFKYQPHLPVEDYAFILYIAVISFTVLQYFSAMYESQRMRSYETEIFQCFKNFLLVLAVILFALFYTKKADISRVFIFLFIACSFFLTALQRVCVKKILKLFRKYGYNIKRMVVVGQGSQTTAFIDAMKKRKETGYVVSFVASCFDELKDYLSENTIDEVVISLSESQNSEMGKIISFCEYCGVKSSIIPDYLKFAPSNPKTDSVDGIILINTRHIPLDNIFYNFIKRFFDIVVSLLLIIILSPLLLAIAITIKFTSKGSVLFKQERVGFNNTPFVMYKFRTMKTGTATDEWTVEHDPRVTDIGRFLRKTSMDELPQLFNVLFGSMSLVGPRPEQVHFVEQFKDTIPKYMLKHRVRPGITGWAQVNGLRGDTSIEERIKKDLYYIENWTFAFDLKILVMTVFKGNKNAY
jgi:Undecaprenyl-phosphate glucose phosphotransferase